MQERMIERVVTGIIVALLALWNVNVTDTAVAKTEKADARGFDAERGWMEYGQCLSEKMELEERLAEE